MGTAKFVASMIFAILMLGTAHGAEKVEKAGRFLTILRPETVQTKVPTVTQRVCVSPSSFIMETIPAVFRTADNGEKILVAPEKVLKHPIPAIYENRTVKLAVEGELANKLKALSADSARVEIVGVWEDDVFKVTELIELK